MKKTYLVFCSLFYIGCTEIPTQHGIARFHGDYANVKFDDGSVHFIADKMVHSTIVRAHYQGVTAVGGELAGAAIGLKGGQEATGAAVTIISNATHRPTNR